MTTLPTQLKIGEFQHTQIRREGMLAIFRQQKEGQSDCFEVIRIKVSKEGERTFPNGKTVFCEEMERYPNANSWGTDGWTFRDLESAEVKFNQVA